MKKLLLTLGAAGATLAPLATVVACGSEDAATDAMVYYGYDTLVEYEAALDVPTNGHHISGSAAAANARSVIEDMLGVDAGSIDSDFTYDVPSRVSTIEHNADFWASATGANFTDGVDYANYEDFTVAHDADGDLGMLGVSGTNLVYKVEASDDAENKKDIIIGAHYDLNELLHGTTGTGTNDNNSGTAGAIELANHFTANPLEDYNVIFGFWDAEENGLNGSAAYAASLTATDVEFYMNLDSIAGGDDVYFGYGEDQNGVDSTIDAKALYESIYTRKAELGGETVMQPYVTYGDETDFANAEVQPKGEMFPGSDHVSFINNDIMSFGFESTNYEVFGSYGRDGYSQTSNASFWYMEDEFGTDAQHEDNVLGGVFGFHSINTAGDSRADLANDGRIWHTKHDSLEQLETIFGANRLREQMNTTLTMVQGILETH